jgi:glycosyltransferase involved in cell wall biosynthesis
MFMGRLEKAKNVELLFAAWHRLAGHRRDWDLCLIGNGSLKSSLEVEENVTVKDFMQPERLREEIASAGCFVLPSRDEPWGVVIHEFAAAGIPLVCSDACGASNTFLIHGTNGYEFRSGNVESLFQHMLKIINASDASLRKMGEYSSCLGQRITPYSSPANLLSVLRRL